MAVALGVDAEIIGVVRAVFVLTEDVPTERRQDRLQVVGIALGPDLKGEALVGRVVGVLGLEVGGDLDHLLERRRRFGNEVGVAHEGDVLDGVGQPVGLSVVGEAVDGDVFEAIGHTSEVERFDDAVGNQFAEPVVSADDDVRSLAARRGERQLVADVAELQLLNGDHDAVLLGERLGDLLYDWSSRVVGPDDEVGVAAPGAVGGGSVPAGSAAAGASVPAGSVPAGSVPGGTVAAQAVPARPSTATAVSNDRNLGPSAHVSPSTVAGTP